MNTRLNKALWLAGTTLTLLFTVAFITHSVGANSPPVTHHEQLSSSLNSQMERANSLAVNVPGSSSSQGLSPQCTVTYSDTVLLSDPSQIGRLITLLTSSTCASPRGCPGVFDNLPRHYKSYTFTNNNTGPTCVTVNLTPGLTGVLLQSAAYLNSFDPLNPCANYLADIGPVPNALGGSYSFNVQSGATYVVVVSGFLPGVGSLPYSLAVSSDPNCPVPGGGTTTPTPNPATQTAIAGTQTSIVGTQTSIAGTQTALAGSATPTPNTCPTYNGSIELNDPLQIGRLVTLLTSSTCALPRGCPGVFDTLPRNYDSYAFTNNNTGPTCVTVRLTPGLTGVLLQSATYLSSFNPLNPCENYLGDIGPVPSVAGGDYSIIVPGGATYVVVVSGFIPGVGSLPYTLNVISNPNCPVPVGGTPTPNPATRTSIAGTQTALAGSMTPTGTPNSGTQTAIAGTRTSIAGTQTSVAGTQTSIAGTQTSIAGTQTALAGTSTPVPTACTRQFTDVPPNHLFYTFIRCLVCRGIISGYQCGGPGEPCDANNNGYFRSFNNIIRGQIAKVVSNSAGFIEDPGVQFYTDVPPSNPFYQWINRLSRRGHMGGYPCGGPFEPCDSENRPYFRWQNNATRGQLSKIVSNTAGFTEPVSGQFYTDVTSDNPFYEWIMRLTNRGVMSGYLCGEQPGEPCDPENRPYFRPFNDVTRGQASKIVANTFFPNCQTPQGR